MNGLLKTASWQVKQVLVSKGAALDSFDSSDTAGVCACTRGKVAKAPPIPAAAPRKRTAALVRCIVTSALTTRHGESKDLPVAWSMEFRYLDPRRKISSVEVSHLDHFRKSSVRA